MTSSEKERAKEHISPIVLGEVGQDTPRLTRAQRIEAQRTLQQPAWYEDIEALLTDVIIRMDEEVTDPVNGKKSEVTFSLDWGRYPIIHFTIETTNGEPLQKERTWRGYEKNHLSISHWIAVSENAPNDETARTENENFAREVEEMLWGLLAKRSAIQVVGVHLQRLMRVPRSIL